MTDACFLYIWDWFSELIDCYCWSYLWLECVEHLLLR